MSPSFSASRVPSPIRTSAPLTGASVPGRMWWQAVHRLNLAKVNAYLEQGVPTSRTHRKEGFTALGWLAQGLVPMHRHAEAVALIDRLVEVGADPLREEPNGQACPLLQALKRPSVVPELVQAMVRGSVWTPERCESALAGEVMAAALRSPARVGALTALLAQGLAATTVRTTVDGGVGNRPQRISALADALRHGTSEDLGRLLDAGARFTEQEREEGLDPYLRALFVDPREAEPRVDRDLRRRTHLLALLDRHVPMTPEGRDQLMPMLMRHPYLDTDLLDRLHAQGARWDGTVRDGHTALHAAMMNPDPGPLVEHLLNQGLDLNARTGKGETPIDRLRSQVHQRTALAPMLVRLERRVLNEVLNDVVVDQPATTSFRDPSLTGRHRL